MDSLGNALAMALNGVPSFDGAVESLGDITPEEAEKRLLRLKVDSYNATPGKLNEKENGVVFDCPKCKNRGIIMRLRENDDGKPVAVATSCECVATRESIAALKKSGLEAVTRVYTFRRFETVEPWQENIKTLAMDFVRQISGGIPGWFFIGGQTGAGKTHICTAIAVQAIKQGKRTLYMVWRDELRRLKGVANTPEYDAQINAWKTVDVLYIDDFLKAGRDTSGRMVPTQADVNIAFELLNYRSNNQLITIISSEMALAEIADVDEATAGRIAQNAKDHCLNIGRGKARNYRLKGVIV